MNKKFMKTEEAIHQLLANEIEFNLDEKAEVVEYLDAGEYGLALETLEEIIAEKENYFQSRMLSKMDTIKKILLDDRKAKT